MHIVIIGNGIAGITAARHIRKQSDHLITVISKETDYFFSRTALMYIYMGHLRHEHTKPYEDWFWQKNNINLLKTEVQSIDYQQKILQISSDYNWIAHKPSVLERLTKTVFKEPAKPPIANQTLHYDKLILATGSVPRLGAWQGQDLAGVQGLYSYQDLELLEKNTKNIARAVIVGGGLIGIELAEMLHSRHIPVTMLVREASYWNNVLPAEESAMITNHIRAHGIDLRLQTQLQQINGTQRVESITTNREETIDCQLVGVSIGVEPQVDFLRQNESQLQMNRGVLVNKYLETNIADVYAIGDCVEHQTPPEGRKNIEQIWYTGRIMGETVAQTICGNRTAYQPSVFFNSAKFFDVEYQTYGTVSPNRTENIDTFYWQHPTKNVSFRVDYEHDSRIIRGVNVLGMRMCQEVWERWILEKKTLSELMPQLSSANFDPEFSENYVQGIRNSFSVTLK